MLSWSACEIVWSILSDIRVWKGLCSRDQDPVICPLHTARPGFALPCDFYRKCHIQVMGMQVWVLSSRGRNGMQLSQTLETLWKRYSMSNTDLPQQTWDNIGIVSARRLITLTTQQPTSITCNTASALPFPFSVLLPVSMRNILHLLPELLHPQRESLLPEMVFCGGTRVISVPWPYRS